MKRLSISGTDSGDDQGEVLGTEEINLVGLGHDVGGAKTKRWCWRSKNKEMILVVTIRAVERLKRVKLQEKRCEEVVLLACWRSIYTGYRSSFI